MPVIQPFYDPAFDYGAPVALTYWASFVGTRSAINQQRMEYRLQQADPSRFQEQIDSLQDAIAEIMELKAKAGRDRLNGMYRQADSRARGDYALRRSETDADVRLALGRMEAKTRLAELDDQQRRYYQEVTTYNDIETVGAAMDRYQEALAGGNQNDIVQAQNDMNVAIDAAAANNNDDANQQEGYQITVVQMMQDRGIGPNETAQGTTASEYQRNVGTDAAQAQRDFGARLMEQDAEERERNIMEYGRGTGGGGGGGGGGGSRTGTSTSGTPQGRYEDELRRQNQAYADVQAMYDTQLSSLQTQLDEVLEQRAAAQRAVVNPELARTRNPMLAPVFTRRSPYQNLADQIAQVARQPGGQQELQTLASEVALEGIEGVPQDFVQGTSVRLNAINADNSGTYLYNYLYNELDDTLREIGPPPDSNATEAAIEEYNIRKAQATEDFARLARLASTVPGFVQAENPGFYDLIEEANAQMIRQPTAYELADFERLRIIARDVVQGQTDIHFADIVRETTTNATRQGADRAASVDQLTDLREFADEAGRDLGGALGQAFINSYDQRIRNQDGRGLYGDAGAIRDLTTDFRSELPPPPPVPTPSVPTRAELRTEAIEDMQEIQRPKADSNYRRTETGMLDEATSPSGGFRPRDEKEPIQRPIADLQADIETLEGPRIDEVIAQREQDLEPMRDDRRRLGEEINAIAQQLTTAREIYDQKILRLLETLPEGQLPQVRRELDENNGLLRQRTEDRLLRQGADVPVASRLNELNQRLQQATAAYEQLNDQVSNIESEISNIQARREQRLDELREQSISQREVPLYYEDVEATRERLGDPSGLPEAQGYRDIEMQRRKEQMSRSLRMEGQYLPVRPAATARVEPEPLEASGNGRPSDFTDPAQFQDTEDLFYEASSRR